MAEELYEVRLLLEPQAARWTAERAPDEQLDEIHALVEAMELALSSGDERAFLDSDRRFHAAILGRGSSNRVLQAILHDINSLMGMCWIPGELATKDLRAVLDQHRAIAAGLVSRDGDAAAGAMTAHVRWAAQVNGTPVGRRARPRRHRVAR
jgi:GntR family transcriptional repressor for pyruvate dehydrogenase complex